MQFLSILPLFLGALHLTFAHDHASITDIAFLPCASGDAQSSYSSCSSSVSSRIEQCQEDDFGCACSLAQSGFGCITSHCPSHTTAICAASYILNGLCGAFDKPGPQFTNFACPTSLVAGLTSLIPIPTNIDSIISSQLQYIPSGVPFFNGVGNESGIQTASGNTQTQSTSTTTTGSGGGASTTTKSPTHTGGASNGGRGRGTGGEVGLFEGLLGVGICVAIAVAGFAALF